MRQRIKKNTYNTLNKIKLSSFIALIFCCASKLHAAPPYSGTVYLDKDIILPSDPSSFKSMSYEGRTSENSGYYNYLVKFDDGLQSHLRVVGEVGSKNAADIEANKLKYALGQVPTVLRRNVKNVFVNVGKGRATANRSGDINLHSGSNDDRIAQGNLEELLLHEATHCSLDAFHRASESWISAQNRDAEFISTYGRDNRYREDLAESIVPYIAYRYRRDRIADDMAAKIENAMSARIEYLDKLNSDMYPIVPRSVGSASLVSPLPASILPTGQLKFSWNGTSGTKWYDLLVGTEGPGSTNIRATNVISSTSTTVSNLPTGGQTINVRLWSHADRWQYKDYTFVAHRPSLRAVLSTPRPNSILDSDSATFRWNRPDRASSFDLIVGTSGPGSSEIRPSRVLSDTSLTLSGLPQNGEPVYVRLWTLEQAWKFYDYTFTAHTPDTNSNAGDCQTIAWQDRVEISLKNGDCIALDRNLQGEVLAVWDSDANSSCDFRGHITAIDGAGSLNVNKNYVYSTSINGTRLKVTATNGCDYLKIRAY